MGKLIKLYIEDKNKKKLGIFIDTNAYPNSWVDLSTFNDSTIKNLGQINLIEFIEGFKSNLLREEMTSKSSSIISLPTSFVFTLSPHRNIIIGYGDENNLKKLYYENTENEKGYISFFEIDLNMINEYINYLSPQYYLKEILKEYMLSNQTLIYNLNIKNNFINQEIQYIKENWDNFKNNVIFYKDGRIIKEPW